jgi:stage V sporulation protein G
MEITDVRVHLAQGGDHLKAFASVILDDAFAVEELKVIEGARGLFVSMPRRKLPDGQYRDVVHPVTKEMREILQTRVLAAYQQALEGQAAV